MFSARRYSPNLQNYDEFATLKALQTVDISNPEAVEAFKAAHYLDDEKQAYSLEFCELFIIQIMRGFERLDGFRITDIDCLDPAYIESEKEKKAFVKLFGEYLRAENILQNYDELNASTASGLLISTVCSAFSVANSS
jgi:hypothetical protein